MQETQIVIRLTGKNGEWAAILHSSFFILHVLVIGPVITLSCAFLRQMVRSCSEKA